MSDWAFTPGSFPGGARRRRRSEGAPFDPLSLSPVTWLRSDVGITITGSGISSWADTLSGGARAVTQATDSRRPTVVAGQQNGHSLIRFDGVDDYLRGTWVQGKPLHMFIVGVANRTAVEINDATICDGANGGSMRIHTSAADHTTMVGGGALEEAGIDSTVCHAFELLANGASSRFTLLDSPADEQSGTIAGTTTGGLTLGEYGVIGVGGICPCDVYEVLQFGSALAAEDLADVTEYLLGRYAL